MIKLWSMCASLFFPPWSVTRPCVSIFIPSSSLFKGTSSPSSFLIIGSIVTNIQSDASVSRGWGTRGKGGGVGSMMGQALKSFDAKSTQKDTFSLLMRIKRPLTTRRIDLVLLSIHATSSISSRPGSLGSHGMHPPQLCQPCIRCQRAISGKDFWYVLF